MTDPTRKACGGRRVSHYSEANPAPPDVRCPSCQYRSRTARPDGTRAATCKAASCRAAARVEATAPASTAGTPCELTGPARVEVWPRSLKPAVLDLPAGTLCVVVGHADAGEPDSGPVLELPCGGRFVDRQRLAKAVP